MVKFYMTTDNRKVIATNSTQCVVVFNAEKSQSVFTYEFGYTKLSDEQLFEVDEAIFMEHYDRATSRVMDLLQKNGKGLRKLLPEAPSTVSNY